MKDGINPVYEKRITELDPTIKDPCRRLLARAFAVGIDARVIQGRRTMEEQRKIYAQGRSAPGRIVTNAKPGYSWHNFGKAFDIGIFRPDGSYVDDNDDLLRFLGPVGEKMGLAWGGRWQHPDYAHFQLKNIPTSPTDEDRRILIA